MTLLLCLWATPRCSNPADQFECGGKNTHTHTHTWGFKLGPARFSSLIVLLLRTRVFRANVLMQRSQDDGIAPIQTASQLLDCDFHLQCQRQEQNGRRIASEGTERKRKKTRLIVGVGEGWTISGREQEWENANGLKARGGQIYTLTQKMESQDRENEPARKRKRQRKKKTRTKGERDTPRSPHLYIDDARRGRHFKGQRNSMRALLPSVSGSGFHFGNCTGRKAEDECRRKTSHE